MSVIRAIAPVRDKAADGLPARTEMRMTQDLEIAVTTKTRTTEEVSDE